MSKNPAKKQKLEEKETPQTVSVENKSVPEKNDFLIEKHRYTKGRLNTRVDKEPNLSLNSRYGTRFIKNLFLLNCCNQCDLASDEQINLMTQYETICKIYETIPWQVNRSSMEACGMTIQEIDFASKKQTATSIPKQSANSIQIKSFVAQKEFPAAALRKRRKVLVPFSGGISSMAVLWWCLLKDYEVHLSYAFGALDGSSEVKQKPAEIECLMRLLQYSRRVDGTLLFDRSDRPESGVYQLSRAEIAQKIKIVQIPQSSYYFEQNADLHKQQPYCDDETGMRSLKTHPQAYLLFYRQMVTVAQSLDCSAIVLGMHGDAKQLLAAAQPFFNNIYQHELLMPFENRTEALVAFQEGAEKSWQVWKSYFENESEEQQGVWQTAGPALMPNASHYVATCSNVDRKSREQLLLQAQTAALERVQVLLAEEIEREQEKFDAAVANGEKVRKKRAPDPFQYSQYLTFFLEEATKLECTNNHLFHFCGNCLDCWQWQEIVKEWQKHTANITRISPQWQNLLTEYIARINASNSKNHINNNDGNIVVTENAPLSAVDLKINQETNNDDDDDKDDDDEEIEEAADEDQATVAEEEVQEDVEQEDEENEYEAGTVETDDAMQEDEEDEEDEEDDEENSMDDLDDIEDDDDDDGADDLEY